MDPIASALNAAFAADVFPSRYEPAPIRTATTFVSIDDELEAISNAAYDLVLLLIAKEPKFEYVGKTKFKPFTQFMDRYGLDLSHKHADQDKQRHALSLLHSGVYTSPFQRDQEIRGAADTVLKLVRQMEGKCLTTVYVWRPQFSQTSVGHAALKILWPSGKSTYISFWPLHNTSWIIKKKIAIFSGPSSYVSTYEDDCSGKYMQRTADDITHLRHLDAVDMLSYWRKVQLLFSKYQVLKSNCSTIVGRTILHGWERAKNRMIGRSLEKVVERWETADEETRSKSSQEIIDPSLKSLQVISRREFKGEIFLWTPLGVADLAHALRDEAERW